MTAVRITTTVAMATFLAFAAYSALKEDTACTNVWCTLAIITALLL